MKESCFGIIPIRYREQGLELLLVKHQAGHWAFPKGHPEAGETAQETALRELQEEVALTVTSFLKAEPLIEYYSFVREGQTIDKSVTYFLAYVEGEPKIHEPEILEAQWLTFGEAHLLATFPELKSLIEKLELLLREL